MEGDGSGFARQMSSAIPKKRYNPPVVPRPMTQYKGTNHKNLAVFIAKEELDSIPIGGGIDQPNWPDEEDRASWGNVDKKTHYQLNLKYNQRSRWCPNGISLKEYKGITSTDWKNTIAVNMRPVAIKKTNKGAKLKSDYGYMLAPCRNVCQNVGFTKGINAKTATLISRDFYEGINNGSGMDPNPTVETSLRNEKGKIQSVILKNASAWEGPPPPGMEVDGIEDDDDIYFDDDQEKTNPPPVGIEAEVIGDEEDFNLDDGDQQSSDPFTSRGNVQVAIAGPSNFSLRPSVLRNSHAFSNLRASSQNSTNSIGNAGASGSADGAPDDSDNENDSGSSDFDPEAENRNGGDGRTQVGKDVRRSVVKNKRKGRIVYSSESEDRDSGNLTGIQIETRAKTGNRSNGKFVVPENVETSNSIPVKKTRMRKKISNVNSPSHGMEVDGIEDDDDINFDDDQDITNPPPVGVEAEVTGDVEDFNLDDGDQQSSDPVTSRRNVQVAIAGPSNSSLLPSVLQNSPVSLKYRASSQKSTNSIGNAGASGSADGAPDDSDNENDSGSSDFDPEAENRNGGDGRTQVGKDARRSVVKNKRKGRIVYSSENEDRDSENLSRIQIETRAKTGNKSNGIFVVPDVETSNSIPVKKTQMRKKVGNVNCARGNPRRSVGLSFGQI